MNIRKSVQIECADKKDLQEEGTMDIEGIATSAVKSMIGRTERLGSYINERDKLPFLFPRLSLPYVRAMIKPQASNEKAGLAEKERVWRWKS